MGNNPRLVRKSKGTRAALSSEISSEDHQRVLELGRDVPDEVPAFQIPLSEVGISGKTLWISLPEGRLPFDAEVCVDLPGQARGIHMSRIEEAISQLYYKPFPDIRGYAQELAEFVLTRQRGQRAKVLLAGKVPLVRKASVSNRRSVDAVDITTELQASKSGSAFDFKTKIGLSLHHITACPCTQVYNQVLSSAVDSQFPMPTHSQRCVTRLCVEDNSCNVTFGMLIECLEATLHVTQDLLKRPDEAEIVLKAHRLPQFAEDTVREAAKEVGKRLKDKLPPASEITIESLSLESIHIHDVRCTLRTTLGDILGVRSD